MKTIYADFNDFDSDGSLLLTCSGSVDSIRQLGAPLDDGEEVWLTDGELWAKARVFKRGDATYKARGDWEYQSDRPADAE